MSIARSIQTLAAFRGKNDARATIIHANALIAGQEYVARANVSAAPGVLIYEYQDGSFLAVGNMQCPFIGALDSATAKLTMAQAYEVFCDALAEIEERHQGDFARPAVPTGTVPCNCAVCRDAKRGSVK